MYGSFREPRRSVESVACVQGGPVALALSHVGTLFLVSRHRILVSWELSCGEGSAQHHHSNLQRWVPLMKSAFLVKICDKTAYCCPLHTETQH